MMDMAQMTCLVFTLHLSSHLFMQIRRKWSHLIKLIVEGIQHGRELARSAAICLGGLHSAKMSFLEAVGSGVCQQLSETHAVRSHLLVDA